MARLAPQKGLDLLLDAVAASCSEDDLDLVTVVAGEGPLRDRLQARIDLERLPVRLLGHRDDVPDLLAAADVVVSSAVWEGQPVGIQEALHAGAAIVATDVGGTGAVVGDAAILVPRGRRGLAGAGDPRRHRRRRSATTCARGRSSASAELPTEDDALEAALDGLPVGAPRGVRGLNTGPRDGNRRVAARVGSETAPQ